MPERQWRPGKRVAIVGGGPGGISTALAFLKNGYDVQVFERQPECQAMGSGVLLSTPVLAILRYYGLDLENVGSYTVATFSNDKGTERVRMPFNAEVEKRMGIKGWHYGVLRSSIFRKILELLPDPENILAPDHDFLSYSELEDAVEITFKNGQKVTADILVGADGIRSGVSKQAFGDHQLFHAGIRVWLAWCDQIPGLSEHNGVISHSAKYQASYFPMLHNGKPGFEWWVVEPAWEGMPVPEDPSAHVKNILKDWAQPMPQLLEATDFETQVFRWDVYNRPSLKKWSTGRVVCLGDAVHPVSPYAAYGMGMAIEDGYFLARSLEGVDLRDSRAVSAGFEIFEGQRVEYVNHNMEFARFLGTMFHSLPWPLTRIRDFIFDYTPFLAHFLKDGYLKQAEEETMNLKELHVA